MLYGNSLDWGDNSNKACLTVSGEKQKLSQESEDFAGNWETRDLF